MSLKKELTLYFSHLPSVDGLNENKLILATPLGLITGRFPTEEKCDDVDNINAILSKLCAKITNDYKTELSLSETDHLPDDEGYLYLVDVEIKTPSNNFTLPFMVVFYDQIIGISIGNI